ncbi:phage tail protein [Ewingella americana]|uniref:Phage tail protein n=2 Tax=Ewingella americana TaxID=41202 RepID=A0A502GLW4_9GAMM|nr:phage tail protein [Ewingella americana]
MSVTAASATATFTADELIVGTALGGLQYRIGSFSKTINLATTGAGGMDTGSAPVSGFVALYAIYNPSTNTSALLAVNATAAVVPEVYGGANMPAGYTASALVSVWQTNASSQFKIGSQYGRRVFFPATSVLSTTGSGSANPFTPFTISAAAPRNAKDVNLTATIGTNTSSAAVYSSVNIAADSGGAGSGTVTVSGASGGNIASSVTMIIPIITPQTLYQTLFASAGTTTYNVVVSFYTF